MRLQWVTNIPTPYRNHRYMKMAEVFPEYDIEFEVLYMAWTEPGRYWRFQARDLNYPNQVYRGLRRSRGNPLHFNPALLGHLASRPADVLVVGGYSSPSHVLAPLFGVRTPVRLMASEGNLKSVRRMTGAALVAKRALIKSYHGYIVPGERTREFLATVDPGVLNKPMIRLPNIVDESVFVDKVSELRPKVEELRAELGVSTSTQLWVCPARLETFKGLDKFLPLLKGLDGITLLVAGEGSLRPTLERLIAADALPVRLMGQVDEAQMVRLYAAADLFVLPSLSDPSPLSPVEASAAQLPLLVSDRIGNLDDVVQSDAGNGWVYAADEPAANVNTLRAIAACSRDELRRRGQVSRALYERNFDSDRCIRRLAEGLLDVWRRR